MPNPAFPGYAKIPFPFAKKRDSALARTQMDDGMVKQSQIKSRVMVTRTFTILLMSAADYANFIIWWKSAPAAGVNYGAAWFDFTDPEDGAVKSARIVNQLDKETPRRKALDRWQIDVQIEMWG